MSSIHVRTPKKFINTSGGNLKTDKYSPMHKDFSRVIADMIAAVKGHRDISMNAGNKFIIGYLRDRLEALEDISRRMFYSFDGSPRATLISLSMDIVIETITHDIDYELNDEFASTNTIFMTVQGWARYYEILTDESNKILSEFDIDKNKNIFNFDDVEKRFRELEPCK